MEEIQNVKLNGFSENTLPDILPGQQNEFIKTNTDGTGYELSDNNSVPTPTSTNQVLNSTNANGAYSWTTEPSAIAFRAGSGSAAGFMWGTANNNRISCQTSTNTITIVAGSGNRITVNQDDIFLSLPTTVSSLLSCNGLSNTGVCSLNGNINQSNGGVLNCGTSGTGNSVNVYGTLTCNKIKHNDIAGTSTNCTIQLDGINTGIYSPGSGQMSITAGGSECVNFQSTRTRTTNILELGRSLAPSTITYSVATSATIFGSSPPFILCLEPSSGTIDLDYQVATNYFGNQQFHILVSTRANSGGSVRYRSQNETIHLSGGILTTIATNTFHTLAENRLHLVICNTDSSRFYLIQY